MICIYAIINIDDDKCYVGQTDDHEFRWREHRKQLRGFYHHNLYLQRAWCKHGEDKFIFVILEKFEDTSRLNDREKHWAEVLKADYNIAPPGEGMRGYKHTDEARERMRQSQLGKTQSEETKAKRAEKFKGNKYAAGIKYTPERIEARAALHRGKPKSEEHKAKIAASIKGRKLSEETRLKQSQAAIARHKRQPVSEETRKKLSEAAFRQWNGS